MRILTSTLEAAQESVSKTPYIYLNFTSAGGGTTYDYTARLLQLEHHEEAYNDYAVITLRNDDRGVADLKGYWVEIGYGFYTTLPGNEYCGDGTNPGTPRLWVKAQQEISLEGRVIVILELEGMWAVLREIQLQLGDPPFYHEEYSTDTIYDIINTILVIAGFTLDALGAEDDGIINTLTPQFDINGAPVFEGYDDCASVIYRLLMMTKCYLRPEAGLAWKVIYPAAAGAVNQSYYSYQAHFFFEYMERRKVLVPNHVIVIANAGEDGTWSDAIIGEAQDSAEVAAYMDIPNIYTAAEITTQADANARALAILTRIKSELLGGRLLIPHDCSVEVYDKPQVFDSR